MSGIEPLMNLEVRVGDENLLNTDENTQMTGNERCGMFFGPTRVPQQWVDWTVDCGYPRGMGGKFLTVQLLDIFGGNHPLEISELEIYG